MTRVVIFRLVSVGLFVVAMALIFLGAELYLRAGAFEPTQYYVRLPGWEIIFHPSPEGTPGVKEDAHIRINALGLRGNMPRGGSAPKILAVGGSTTEDIVLNDPDTWPGRLEAELASCHSAVWVGNMGKAGSNARHHYLQLEKTLPRIPRPDRVIELVGLNDMLFDAGLHTPANLPQSWWEQQAFDYIPTGGSSLFDRSAVFQAMKRVVAHIGNLVDGKAALVRVVDFGDMEKSYKERWRHVGAEDWVTSPPDVSGPLKAYRAVLERTVDLVTASGSQLSFITQPFLWKPNMTQEETSRLYAGGVGSVDEWFKNPRTKWFTTDVMTSLLSAYNDVTRQVCKERGLACIDLAAELPKSADIFYDDFHFSAAGAAAVARIVGARMPERCAKK